MANYDDLIKISGNVAFQDRVKYALTHAAIDVYSEASSTTGHQARLAYATGILGGSYNLGPASLAILCNPTIAGEATLSSAPDFGIPDSDIQFAVSSLWNALANA